MRDLFVGVFFSHFPPDYSSQASIRPSFTLILAPLVTRLFPPQFPHSKRQWTPPGIYISLSLLGTLLGAGCARTLSSPPWTCVYVAASYLLGAQTTGRRRRRGDGKHVKPSLVIEMYLTVVNLLYSVLSQACFLNAGDVEGWGQGAACALVGMFSRAGKHVLEVWGVIEESF